VAPRYADYLPDDGGRVDLADLIANTIYEDPEPRIWIAPLESDDPEGPWNASCQCGEDAEEFEGARDEVIAWARRTPAAKRYVRAGGEDVTLSPEPGDAPPPPAAGPTVQVQGPNYDGRWVGIWFHHGQLEQFWGGQEEVIGWANSQPASRRRISIEGDDWRPMPTSPS
jgi:hypothetical protein